MTGIPRLQHLPVPVATTGATAVALPESGRQAKAVVPVTPVHPRQAQAERSTAWSGGAAREGAEDAGDLKRRSEEHTSELQSLMRISYAVFCLKKTKQHHAEQRNTEYET